MACLMVSLSTNSRLDIIYKQNKLLTCFVTTFSPGFAPAFGDTGFGGGGLVLGSVGRSVLVGLGMRLATGGVIGRGILRGGGDEGLGGRGRDEVGFEDGGFRCVDAEGRAGEVNDRDLKHVFLTFIICLLRKKYGTLSVCALGSTQSRNRQNSCSYCWQRLIFCHNDFCKQY